MNFIKKVLQLLVLLVFVFGGGALIFGLMLPPDWSVRRSIEIQTPPARVYPLFADLANWPKWSPWQKKDPAMKVTLEGKSSGAGARQTWVDGAGKNSGETEMLEAVRNKSVSYRVILKGDFESKFECSLMLDPITGEGSELIWLCRGKEEKLLPKLFAQVLFDRFMGPDFESGLAGIKAAAEASR